MTDKTPFDILKERYVNGEITKEQFDEMKDSLESVYKSKKKMSTRKKIGIWIGSIIIIFFIISWYIGMTSLQQAGISQSDLQQAIKQKLASQQQPTTSQNTPQSTINENPLSLSSSYLNDFGKYTSNECSTSGSPVCMAIVNTLQQDCSNPALLQIESASCDLLNSTLNIRQSYLKSLSPTIAQNWAGYIAESDLYNPQPVVGQVSASWQVIPIPSSNLDQEMAQWIGIGGYANIGGSTDESLIQVGTSSENVCDSNQQCTLNYTAWYEIYPHNYETPLMSVNPGDTITALINCEPNSAEPSKQDTCNGKTQEWTILITDETKKKAGITPFSGLLNTKFSSSLLSADWIIERRCPSSLFSSCDLAVSLPEFGNGAFTNSTVAIGAKFGSIKDFKYVNLSMTSNGQSSGALLAYPSDLSNNGSSFTVTSGYQTSSVFRH
jgi:Peptidase A4 family/Short C-terminal domain